MQYMLYTNTVNHLIKRHPQVSRRIVEVPMAFLCISSITEGELLFGLAKRPDARRLHTAVKEFLLRVDVLPWNCAARYGAVRADIERRGKTLGSLDLLIGTHALNIGAVLVTNDRAFSQLADLHVEDWTA